ncbi:MAG TPA: Gfo/Idh/MocA family oxidoreductase [Gaiellaceae bacterium]|nr:Gfo/Idh/MocA family oxidoreductase [Gaiellaceae bacterium]
MGLHIEPLRVALVGAGGIAARHLAELSRRDDVDVVAVCDRDPVRAAALAPAEAKVYERVDDLLDGERPDALWVCTPPLAHREATVAALARGVHVYLEKPIARTLDDADAIHRAASGSDAVCAIGYQWRAIDILDAVREALQGQELALLLGRNIGPADRRPWFLDRAQGGGNLLERGSHQIDLVHALGAEVGHVQAAASPIALGQAEGVPGDIDDAVVLILHLGNGGLANLVVAWTRAAQPGIYALDIVAEEATLTLTLDPEFTLRGVSAGRSVEARASTDPFRRSIEGFLEAVREHDPARVFCRPEDAVRTLAVAHACEVAMSTGASLPV